MTKHIDRQIDNGLRRLDEVTKHAFETKLQGLRQAGDKAALEFSHTFRELLLGLFLQQYSYVLRYEYGIDGKTPDWGILAPEDRSCLCLIEVLNFHTYKDREVAIGKCLKKGKVITYFNSPKPKEEKDQKKQTPSSDSHELEAEDTKRLYQALEKKASTYKKIANANGLAYVIAMYNDLAPIEDELDHCLRNDDETGIFQRFPHVSGVIFFEQRLRATYQFTYFPNPTAQQSFKLPTGALILPT